MTPQIKNYLDVIMNSVKDPYKIYSQSKTENLIKNFLATFDNPKILGIVDAGLVEGDVPMVKEPKKDAILDNFLTGAQGVFAGSKHLEDIDLSTPIVVRGIAKKKVMHKAVADGRDFYYIDTGYFGNEKTKLYHRVVKNGLQFNLPIWSACPDDRFMATSTQIRKKTSGRNILLCPPSQKALNYWDVNLETWILQTTETIKRYTDRPIVIREKANRQIRTNDDTMEMALSRDVHCLVTYNSIAAVEALILGKPVFTMGPNAAGPLANKELSRIEQPMMPVVDRVRQLCCNLAYGQFTPAEMIDGTAWRLLQEFYERK